MSIEVLNAELVSEMIEKHGLKRSFVIAKLGLGQKGYEFLRGEWMPKKDAARKATLLKALAKLLGVEVPQILLTLEPRRMQRPA
jgi:hypothetical protein